ncbi:MAG: ATP-binding protein [Butyrivibrio sp.]
MKTPAMFLYRNVDNNRIFSLMKEIAYDSMDLETIQEDISEVISHILAVSEKMGFKNNLWQDYVAYIIVNNENPFSVSCERRGYVEGSINQAALHDFEVFLKVFSTDLYIFDYKYNTNLSLLTGFTNNNEGDRYFNKRIRNSIIELADRLSLVHDAGEFLNTVCNFYKEIGVGKFGLFKAFRISDSADIEPVISVEHIYLNDLIGYELQKKKLTDNTEAFLNGRKANNVLLFGDSGTGKSSSIKALLNEYYDRGLRMIEIYKHQFRDLSSVINQIKDRNYKFIIYMDDLSFEEFEIEYKFLKAVIEGGLEKRPDNVLIYATSNRRHLVREKFSDKEERDDDLHSRDTVQEKLSLSARFGVTIYYGSPDKKQFNEIIKGLARKNNINIDEQTLLMEANKWEISHGGRSGRNAQQFINYLSALEASPDMNN